MTTAIGTMTGLIIFIAASTTPAGAPLGARDLQAMHAMYTANELKFEHTFVGRRFEAALPLNSASGSWIGKTQHLYLGNGGFAGDILCDVSDDAALAIVAKVDKGDNIVARGTVHDSIMGTIILSDCSIGSE
jgi:hypothetical protein